MADHRHPLTHLQAQVLSYLVKFLQMNDQLPTCDNIAAAFGWASSNSASLHIKALEKKGYLARNELGNLMLADRPAPTAVYMDPESITPEVLDELQAYARSTKSNMLLIAKPAEPGEMLSSEQRVYLAQAWTMLEDYALGYRAAGNDSVADGAMASAHVIKEMLIARTLGNEAQGQETAHG